MTTTTTEMKRMSIEQIAGILQADYNEYALGVYTIGRTRTMVIFSAPEAALKFRDTDPNNKSWGKVDMSQPVYLLYDKPDQCFATNDVLRIIKYRTRKQTEILFSQHTGECIKRKHINDPNVCNIDPIQVTYS